MTKTELDGKPMLRVFKAIIQLRAAHHLATSPRIAQLIGRRSAHTSTILGYLWDWGYLQRKLVKTNGSKDKKVQGCTFYYKISKKGERKYKTLLETFGDLQLNQPQTQPQNQQQQTQRCLTPSKAQGTGWQWVKPREESNISPEQGRAHIG